MDIDEAREHAEDLINQYGTSYSFVDVCDFFPMMDEEDLDLVIETAGQATIYIKWENNNG